MDSYKKAYSETFKVLLFEQPILAKPPGEPNVVKLTDKNDPKWAQTNR